MKTSWALLIAATCAQFISSVATGPQPGDSPPPLGLESMLQAPGGELPDWTALKGKVVVLEFWATWCGPCVAAMPHLNELADRFKDQPVQFIAIADQEEKEVVLFLRKKPIHAWIGLDTDKSMFKAYGITSIPHTVVVDQKGRIAAVTNPTSLTEEHLTDLLAGKTIAFAQRRSEKPSTRWAGAGRLQDGTRSPLSGNHSAERRRDHHVDSGQRQPCLTQHNRLGRPFLQLQH